jgi:hypothetical protein
LKEKGSLDEFVNAKLEGDDVVAKWHLLETADKEIKEIVKENEIKEIPPRKKLAAKINEPKNA